MKRERRGAGPPLALRFTLRVLYSQFSIEALELRNIAAARVDLHLDTPSGDVAALDLPFAVVELELANVEHAVRHGDVARVAHRDHRAGDADGLSRGGRRRETHQRQRGDCDRGPHDGLLPLQPANAPQPQQDNAPGPWGRP